MEGLGELGLAELALELNLHLEVEVTVVVGVGPALECAVDHLASLKEIGISVFHNEKQ